MASIKKIVGKRSTSYKITVCLGRDMNGKRIERYKTYTPETTTRTGKQRTEKSIMQEVEEYARKFEQECKEVPGAEKKLTVQQLSERWMKEFCEMQLTPGTCINHKTHLDRRILPRFGSTKISDITPYSVQKFINDSYTGGERFDQNKGKPLSPATIKKLWNTMSAMFSWAVDQGLIAENPCRKVHTIRQDRENSDIKAWNLEETAAFLQALEEQDISIQFKLFFHLALFCGARRGEIIALRWTDIDWDRKQIYISKSVFTAKGEVIEKKPKTKSSIRYIGIDDVCLELLQRWQRQQFIYQNSIKNYWQGEDFIFIQDNGSRMYPSTPYKKFKTVINRYNQNRMKNQPELPEISMHGLRHTSATLLIAEGVDMKTVSARLGHAKTSTTMDIYAHALASADQKATNILSKALVAKKSECRLNVSQKIN